MSIRSDADLSQVSHPPAEQRVFLNNVRWATYAQLLADLASQSSPQGPPFNI